MTERRKGAVTGTPYPQELIRGCNHFNNFDKRIPPAGSEERRIAAKRANGATPENIQQETRIPPHLQLALIQAQQGESVPAELLLQGIGAGGDQKTPQPPPFVIAGKGGSGTNEILVTDPFSDFEE
ncbi:hypothetical protein IPN35_00705 [Candidatus Peregrinibacteria bacterium]|nr:MAG: hypothetical protein IPN35_00705 [Candidatus Peregrinibacteria bacterium]